VVNFDVFGNVSHQAQTRLYFDLIRNGAEVNFLRLMPAESRKSYLDDWYQNSGKLKIWLDYQAIDSDSPSALHLIAGDPKRSFVETLLERYGSLNARPDPINRCSGAHCHRSGITAELQRAEQSLSRLTGKPGGTLKVINQLPEATLLRVELTDGQREVYSLLRNRGIGAGPQSDIPQSLFDNLGISRDKAEEAVNKVLAAEVALRELAAQFHPAH